MSEIRGRGMSDEAIAATHAKLLATFRTGRTETLAWRRGQLESLRRLCVDNGEQICAALYGDFGRPKMEVEPRGTDG